MHRLGGVCTFSLCCLEKLIQFAEQHPNLSPQELCQNFDESRDFSLTRCLALSMVSDRAEFDSSLRRRHRRLVQAILDLGESVLHHQTMPIKLSMDDILSMLLIKSWQDLDEPFSGDFLLLMHRLGVSDAYPLMTQCLSAELERTSSLLVDARSIVENKQELCRALLLSEVTDLVTDASQMAVELGVQLDDREMCVPQKSFFLVLSLFLLSQHYPHPSRHLHRSCLVSDHLLVAIPASLVVFNCSDSRPTVAHCAFSQAVRSSVSVEIVLIDALVASC